MSTALEKKAKYAILYYSLNEFQGKERKSMEQYAVHSLDRTFQLLEILSLYPQGLPLTTLAKMTELNKSTAFRLLASLCRHGYVLKNNQTNTYHVSLKLFELGCRSINAGGFLPIIQSTLQSLAVESNEAIHFVLREGGSVVYLYKEEPAQRMVHMTSCVGLRNPMYCTGVGKAILAFLPPEEQQLILNTTEYIPFTAHTLTTPQEVETQLLAVRQRGYAIDNQEHEEGIGCVAAPILNDLGIAYAAISIAAPASRLTEEKIRQYAALLCAAAEKIAVQLNGKSPAASE